MEIKFDKEMINEKAAQYNVSVREYLNEVFSPFTSIGCYSKIFLDYRGDVICHKCALDEFIINHGTISYDVYYEGDPIECEDCDSVIHSAYGPVE